MTSPTEVIGLLGAVRVVPVVTIDDVATAVPLAGALVEGGLTAIEITLRTPVALEAIRRVVAEVPDAVVGAGSVLSSDQALDALDAGARFVVSPGFDAGVLESAGARGVLAVPGVATATELMRAASAGADVVKVFPAELAGGPALIDAFAAVWPAMRFVPTGGIDPASAQGYLRRDCVLAVGGSWMVSATAVGARDWAGVARAATEAARLAQEPS